MAEFMTAEELKALMALCRAGELHEVEKWIASGKSISALPKTKKTPLNVAIEVGFHSLVELLVYCPRNNYTAVFVRFRDFGLVQPG